MVTFHGNHSFSTKYKLKSFPFHWTHLFQLFCKLPAQIGSSCHKNHPFALRIFVPASILKASAIDTRSSSSCIRFSPMLPIRIFCWYSHTRQITFRFPVCQLYHFLGMRPVFLILIPNSYSDWIRMRS